MLCVVCCCVCVRERQVEELFVDKVHQIVYFKEMSIRSRKAALEFAEAAVKHMYKGGLSINAEQDTNAGIMLHKYSSHRPPRRVPAHMRNRKVDATDACRAHSCHGAHVFCVADGIQ